MNHRTIQFTTVGVVLLVGLLSLLGIMNNVPGSLIMGGIGVGLVIYGYIAHRIIDNNIDYTPPS